jgi:hypothetical protein
MHRVRSADVSFSRAQGVTVSLLSSSVASPASFMSLAVFTAPTVGSNTCRSVLRHRQGGANASVPHGPRQHSCHGTSVQ